MRLRWETERLPLAQPFRAAWGEIAEREILRVTLQADDGELGVGEAAPLEPYDGVPIAAVGAALDAYANVLAGAPPDAEREELIGACFFERDLPQALAAIDVALWDIEARRAGASVAVLLHPHAEETVPLNATVTADDRAGASEEALRAVEAGFRCLKVKVGLGDDAGRVAAVRAAVGPDVAIRVDANGAWADADEALANLHALAPAGIEFAEEPVHGAELMAEVREDSPVPIAMDETAADLAAIGSGAADLVCLKISRCSGITGLMRAAIIARNAGSDVYVASTLDGPAGLAAGLHAAAALAADGPIPACGLTPLDGRVELVDGRVRIPAGPGLGVSG